MNQQMDPSKIRSISLTEKRDIMWNVLQPGDPYDIRKSMIAKLPGERKFMGGHLELVCLLQAAEIQRLCQYLQQFRLKVREQERVSLDRHSYEIQIKELTEKLLSDESCRGENEKLKEFIRRQSKELEELQRSQNLSELTKKYESSLIQAELLTKQNSSIKAVNKQIQSQLLALREKLRMLQESKSNQIELLSQKLSFVMSSKEELQRERDKLREQFEGETKHKLQQQITTLKDYENRFHLLAEQIERLNACLREKSKDLNEQNVRNQQLKDEKKYLDDQKSELDAKVKGLLAEINNFERQSRQILREKSSYQQRQTLIREYESRIGKLSVQVDRLNSVLRKKVSELDEYRKKVRDQQLSISNMQLVEKETDALRARFSEASKKMFEYQKQTTVQGQQIDRLNLTLKRMIDQINVGEVKLKNNEKQLDNQLRKCLILETELGQRAKTESELKQTNRQIISQIKQENDHLKEKMLNYQSIYQQNNVLRAQIDQHELQKEALNEQVETLRREKNLYQQQIEEYQGQIEKLRRREIEREESQALKQSQEELSNEIVYLKEQLFRINSERLNLNDTLEKFTSENQKLLGENSELKEKLEGLGEYYKKVMIFSEEINRLNSVLLSKEEEIKEYNGHLMEYQSKMKYFQENISNITNQLQDYRRKAGAELKVKQYETILQDQLSKSREKDEKLLSYQGKITVIGSEIERLNKILMGKVEQIQTLQRENKKLINSNEELKGKSIYPSSEDCGYTECKLKIAEKDRQIQRMAEIITQKDRRLDSLTEEYYKEKRNLNAEILRLSQEVSHFQAKNEQLAREFREAKRELQSKLQVLNTLGSYQSKMMEYKKQIDRLNKAVLVSSNQIESFQQNGKGYLTEIERLNSLLRLKIEESQMKTEELREAALEMEELKNQLNKERKDRQFTSQSKDVFSDQMARVKGQMHVYEQRIKELHQEFERLQLVMKGLKEQNQELPKLKNEIDQLIEKNRWLGGEIDRLNQTIEKQNLQLKEMRMSLADSSSLERRVSQDLSLMVVLFAEIESLRERLSERDDEALSLRRQLVGQFRV